MTGLYIALSAVAGALLPLQALINARIGGALNGAMMGALVNFVVGTVALSVVLILIRFPHPSATQIASAPWWAWLGGLMGAFFVLTGTLAVQTLGAAGFSAVVIAGQLMSAVLLDHFGFLGPTQSLSLSRAVGVVCLLLGVFLILKPVKL
ncbi:MAG: DMT family transporter [Hyphomicrobiales bacterium]|nr:DMT family transporter [Hyphomicrobiales bacterium]